MVQAFTTFAPLVAMACASYALIGAFNREWGAVLEVAIVAVLFVVLAFFFDPLDV